MSERYYVNLPLALGPFTLDGPEAHHLATVCRLRPGDAVCLFNGDGREYPSRVVHVARREVHLEVLEVCQPLRELPFSLEVAAPIPKGDRGQFLIEKLTELGVTTFVPLICERSNAHPRETRRDKLERHVIEASKQCGRNVLMQIGELATWADYCNREKTDALCIFAHPEADAAFSTIPFGKSERRPVQLAVGPEGGFTDEEIALAQQHGWIAVSLGPRILRLETAAITLAIAVAQF